MTKAMPCGATRLDEDSVARWLVPRLGLDRGSLMIQRASSGHSNEMFKVRSGAQQWMLRCPPAVSSASGAHDVEREFTLLTALDQNSIPHAQPVLLCEDPAIAGRPFLLTEWLEGEAGQSVTDPWLRYSSSERARIAVEIISVLAAISLVDWERVGLSGFGRPVGFLERQVDRWLLQLARYRTRDLPHLDEVAAWLSANRPPGNPSGLLHGDYGAPNLMFDHGAGGRIVGVIDWELATIGDPMLDLGWFLVTWEQGGDEIVGRTPGRRISELPGMPTRGEMAARYAELTGLSLRHLSYYQVLALFKLSCLLEGSYMKFVRGQSSDPTHGLWGDRVLGLLRRAAEIIDGRWA